MKRAKNGSGFYFNLYAANRLIVATSQIYTTLSVCKKGVQSVVRNAEIADIEDQTIEGWEPRKNPKFEMFRDNGGQFRFRLRATNGEKILASQGYTTKANCKKGIQSVRDNVRDPKFFQEDSEGNPVVLNLITSKLIEEPVTNDMAELLLFTDRPLSDIEKPKPEVSDEAPAEEPIVPAPQEKPAKKKGFFARLFGK